MTDKAAARQQLIEARQQELGQCELDMAAVLEKYDAVVEVVRIVRLVNGAEHSTYQIRAVSK